MKEFISSAEGGPVCGFRREDHVSRIFFVILITDYPDNSYYHYFIIREVRSIMNSVIYHKGG